MENEEKDIIESEIDTETTENADTTDNVDIEDEEQEDVETLKKRIKTLEAQKKHYREKLEKTGKTESKPVVNSSSKDTNLSQMDMYALIKNNVPEEDIPEVLEYAQLKKIPVSEALKSSVVKGILSEKEEFRKTASATNTNTARRGASKISDEALLANANKGILPDSPEELARLFRVRKGLK